MSHENWNSERTMTQKSQVREWLLQGKHLTPLDALRRFGSLRLSAIIFELREEGLPIETERLQLSPRKRVAKYYLPKDYLETLNQ